MDGPSASHPHLSVVSDPIERERLRVLVVDGAPAGREQMRRAVAECGVEVLGACGDAEEARSAVRALRPDAVFLDVELLGGAGLELARELDAAGGPAVVFVTRNPDCAVDAFDVGAVYCVVKPPKVHACRRALDRVRRIAGERNGTAAGPSSSPAQYLTRIFVRVGSRLVPIPAGEIESIEVRRRVVWLRARGEMYVTRTPLFRLATQLDPTQFVRTHRAHIVNASRIRALHPVSHGDYTIVMDSGAEVPLSRSYRQSLLSPFEDPDENPPAIANSF